MSRRRSFVALDRENTRWLEDVILGKPAAVAGRTAGAPRSVRPAVLRRVPRGCAGARDQRGDRRRGPYDDRPATRLVAQVAIETGIAPNALLEAPEVLEAIVEELEERARKAKAEEQLARLKERTRG